MCCAHTSRRPHEHAGCKSFYAYVHAQSLYSYFFLLQPMILYVLMLLLYAALLRQMVAVPLVNKL
jgi:hypothetical protein